MSFKTDNVKFPKLGFLPVFTLKLFASMFLLFMSHGFPDSLGGCMHGHVYKRDREMNEQSTHSTSYLNDHRCIYKIESSCQIMVYCHSTVTHLICKCASLLPMSTNMNECHNLIHHNIKIYICQAVLTTCFTPMNSTRVC